MQLRMINSAHHPPIPNNMIKSGQLRAVVYIRVSSEDQTKGYGPQYQREETLKVALERDGCLVAPEHIIDDSKTGVNDNRPGWQRVLSLAKSRQIDVVYFWKLDRMMRDEYYYYVNEKELRDAGVELRFATQDLKDPFTRAIHVAVAAEERRKILERTYAGRVRAIRDGKWLGVAPYGYERGEDLRLRVNPDEAKWVKQFFAWLVDERLTLSGIASRGRMLRVPTRYDTMGKQKPRNGACFWSRGTIARILANEAYAGVGWFRKYHSSDDKGRDRELRPESEWIQVSIPPLISPQMYSLAAKQLRLNRDSSPRRRKRDYLFAGKLRCAACDRKITGATLPRNETRIYRGTRWTDTRCGECCHYAEHRLDSAIWPNLLAFLGHPTALAPSIDQYRAQADGSQSIEYERAGLARADARLQQQEKALLECELEGFYAPATIREKRAELASQRRLLDDKARRLSQLVLAEEQRSAAVASATRIHALLHDGLVRADYDMRRRVYGTLVESIVLRRTRADVWLRLPAISNAEPVAQQLREPVPESQSSDLCRSSRMDCDTNERDPIQIPAMFSVALPAVPRGKHLTFRQNIPPVESSSTDEQRAA
jgi:site-specific DNA recombinase